MTKQTNQANSVVEMVRQTAPGDPCFADDLQKLLNKRRLVGQLANLRNLKGISQAAVAQQLGCTQGRISKLENGCDEDVSISDLTAYAQLADCDLKIVFSHRGDTLVDRVKHHALAIKDCFDKLRELAAGDLKIGQGVAQFHLEALLSLVGIVDAAATGPRRAVGACGDTTVDLEVHDAALAREIERQASHPRGPARDNKQHALARADA